MKYTYLLLFPILLLVSCGQEFLDIRREAHQVVPSTISDYQAILDVNSIMNGTPAVELGITGADEFYVGEADLMAVPAYQRNGYTWANDVYEGEELKDWNYAYQRILYANMALEARSINKLSDEKEARDQVVGTALFHRAYNYYQLVQLFCKPYNAETATVDPGVPLKLDPDVSESVERGTLEEVYRQIISDLQEAVALLPEMVTTKFRPNKAAACILLARAYLQMDDFEQATHYATIGLGFHDVLIDFNGLDPERQFTFDNDYGVSNPEILFFWRTNFHIVLPTRMHVDTLLLAQYGEHDLRRATYFKEMPDGRITFKGSYSGISGFFVGLATDELWLIRAECRIRTGDLEGGVLDLNHLLRHRMDNRYFEPVVPNNVEDALERILMERRKELFFRGVRWEDLRRLNKDHRTASTIRRKVDDQLYELPPDDPRWVWPIPDNEVDLSGLQQNPR